MYQKRNMKILIICTGNSCRSRMSQGFLQSFEKNIEVHSGGSEKPVDCGCGYGGKC